MKCYTESELMYLPKEELVTRLEFLSQQVLIQKGNEEQLVLGVQIELTRKEVLCRMLE